MVKNLPAMQETWVQSLGQENPLEKGMATHSSILAWRISWTEEPGGLSPWVHKESDTTEWLSLWCSILGEAKFTSGVNGDSVWGERKKKKKPLGLWASFYGDGLTMRIFNTLFGVIKLQWFGPVELRKEMKEKEIWAKWQQAVPEKKIQW